MEEQVVQAGNQIYLYIGMGVTVAFVALDKAMAFISKKKNNGKGNGNNGFLRGYYREITENTTRSKLNEQAINAMCKTINGMKEENREDHKTIFSKLDGLFEKVK